jgi:hypothetical protein
MIFVVESGYNPADIVGDCARTNRSGDNGQKESTSAHFPLPCFPVASLIWT